MKEFIRIGIDLGKRWFHLHAVTDDRGVAVRRKLGRSQFLRYFSGVAPCLIGMEACGSAHYWARALSAMGHDVKLMPPVYVKPYVKRGKNAAADAEAICEAVTRPGMRFVAIKSAEQQAELMLHKTRDLLIKQRTMSVNALRGHLAEFGLVVARGVGHFDDLLTLATMVEAQTRLIDEIDAKITDICAKSERCRLVDGVPGIGAQTASAIVATMPDHNAFATGRDFAAWLGLTPRQNSTGGKPTLGAITKRGNTYVRRLLVLGATSLLRQVKRRKGALADWINALRARKPARLVTLALANKMARIVWAMLKTGEVFRADRFARA